jgi:hypothetical protein
VAIISFLWDIEVGRLGTKRQRFYHGIQRKCTQVEQYRSTSDIQWNTDAPPSSPPFHVSKQQDLM